MEVQAHSVLRNVYSGERFPLRAFHHQPAVTCPGADSYPTIEFVEKEPPDHAAHGRTVRVVYLVLSRPAPATSDRHEQGRVFFFVHFEHRSGQPPPGPLGVAPAGKAERLPAAGLN